MRWIICGDSHWHEKTFHLSCQRIQAQLSMALIATIYNFYHSHTYVVSSCSLFH